MTDIVLEIARALVLLAIFILVLMRGKHVVYGREGWKYICYGFGLILFGTVIDLTDNFESLNYTMLLGDTPGQAFLEKVVGYLGGFVLLAFGLWRWLPEVQKVGDADRKLLAANEQAEFVFENSPTGMVRGMIGTPDVERNQAFAEILGFDSPEEIDERVRSEGGPSFLWKDPNHAKEIHRKLKTSPVIKNHEAVFRRKDGSDAWLLVDYVNMSSVGHQFEGEKEGYAYCFVKDITREKLALQALAESEERLKLIVDMMPVGVYLVDLADHTVVQANPACASMLQRTQDELVGSHCCDKICPNKEELCPFVASKLQFRSHEGLFTKKDGTQFPVMKTVTRVAMQGRDFLLETFVDISEQKRLEQLKEEVDRIMRHDLRSPVTSVVSAANYSLMDDSVQGETRVMFESIKRQGKKILEMIGLSLALYKIESGIYENVMETVDLAALAGELAAELDDAFGGKTDIRVSIDGQPMADGVSCEVRADMLLLRSLVMNLLTNSVEAAGSGRAVDLDISGEPGVIMVFRNPGVVPEDIRRTFFNKYTTRGKAHGTGLGTYTAQLLARHMGGSVDMDTNDAEDRTEITVRLPLNLV